ncbi:MAG TPA: hypothetical protein VHK04_03005 [Castellaniella sp.]|nr:hypothetical protein [Castellaniella sp.]
MNQSKSNLRSFNTAKITLLPGSTGNRFYYLGAGKGLKMIEVTIADGSKARVPTELGIMPGPVRAWVSDSRPEWEAEIARWQAAVKAILAFKPCNDTPTTHRPESRA